MNLQRTEVDSPAFRFLRCERFCTSCGAEFEPLDLVWTDTDGNAFCCQRCSADFERTGRAVEPTVAERAADARRFELIGASGRKRQSRMFL
jgi:hypothetical protein